MALSIPSRRAVTLNTSSFALAGPSTSSRHSRLVSTASATSSSSPLHPHTTGPSYSGADPRKKAANVLRMRAQARIRSIEDDTTRKPRSAALLEPSQPPTLTDGFKRSHNYLRLSLTEKCSFRCTYCMPAEGVSLTPRSSLLTTEELLSIAKAFVEMGVDKIKLTGGEPLLRKDIVEIIRYLKREVRVPEVGITTNALVLERSLDKLVEAGLDSVNISIDSLRADRFAKLSRMPEATLARVRSAIDKALQIRQQQLEQGISALKVKLNVVVIKGTNEDEVADFVDFTRTRDVEVRFIEYMPFNSNAWATSSLTASSSILDALNDTWGPQVVRDHDSAHDTTRHYSISGYKGRFGFISSMTDHFCSTCNRIRVTADGNLKVCLFGNTEVSLRDALRSANGDDATHLKGLISEALNRKHFKHAGMQDPTALWHAAEQGREMSRIGG